MAYTYPRTPEDLGGVSLYLLRSFGSAAVFVLVLLSTGAIAHGQTLAFRNPRDLLMDEPATIIELLEAARPAPVSMEDMGAILRALPAEGEITNLGATAQQKVDAVRQLLSATRRDWYEIKVIDLPQAGMALHARAVVLIPAPTIALLSGAELQAMVAHEIGHEYLWTEWHRAHQQGDQERLKELELVCDAIAAVTLGQLGMDPSRVTGAIEKVARFEPATVWVGYQREELSNCCGTPGVCSPGPAMAAGFELPISFRPGATVSRISRRPCRETAGAGRTLDGWRRAASTSGTGWTSSSASRQSDGDGDHVAASGFTVPDDGAHIRVFSSVMSHSTRPCQSQGAREPLNRFGQREDEAKKLTLT